MLSDEHTFKLTAKSDVTRNAGMQHAMIDCRESVNHEVSLSRRRFRIQDRQTFDGIIS